MLSSKFRWQLAQRRIGSRGNTAANEQSDIKNTDSRPAAPNSPNPPPLNAPPASRATANTPDIGMEENPDYADWQQRASAAAEHLLPITNRNGEITAATHNGEEWYIINNDPDSDLVVAVQQAESKDGMPAFGQAVQLPRSEFDINEQPLLAQDLAQGMAEAIARPNKRGARADAPRRKDGIGKIITYRDKTITFPYCR